jgi:hypothetical protein
VLIEEENTLVKARDDPLCRCLHLLLVTDGSLSLDKGPLSVFLCGWGFLLSLLSHERMDAYNSVYHRDTLFHANHVSVSKDTHRVQSDLIIKALDPLSSAKCRKDPLSIKGLDLIKYAAELL